MENIQELQQFVTDREWRAQLSRKEAEIISRVTVVTSRKSISSVRYDPMFSYGSDKYERWNVINADGSKNTLNIQCGGNTDGLWFVMEVK